METKVRKKITIEDTKRTCEGYVVFWFAEGDDLLRLREDLISLERIKKQVCNGGGTVDVCLGVPGAPNSKEMAISFHAYMEEEFENDKEKVLIPILEERLLVNTCTGLEMAKEELTKLMVEMIHSGMPSEAVKAVRELCVDVSIKQMGLMIKGEAA